jgi:hypothetical protein
MRRILPTLACVLVLSPLSTALAAGGASTATRTRAGGSARSIPGPEGGAGSRAAASTTSETPIPVPASNTPPASRRLSAARVLAIAATVSKMKALKSEYPGSYGGAYLKGSYRWQVSYFSRGGKKEIGQVIIDDATGRVLAAWTGFQVAWTMARGYPGAFGRHAGALYVWLPLCLLFLLPFVNFRRPLSLLNLDLLVLLSFSVSLAFFNHANIYASVPLSYPPLLYLLARMLAMLRRGRAGARPVGPLKLLIPAPWLAVGVVFLLSFRIALNVTDANVIDVGYAGVIGAQRIVEDRPLYGSFPSDNEHGDTYGPVNYEAYIPFEQLFGWSGTWDDLPAAHAAAVFFDLLSVALLFLIGRRMRGPTLGIALAYAWAAYPFTLFTLDSDSNDALPAVLVLAAVLAATYRSRLATGARGVMAALAGLSKLAQLALVPVLSTHGLREMPRSRRPLAFALFVAGFLAAAAVVSIPALDHSSLQTIYDRTLLYQSERGSPFSVWGLYGLQGLQKVAEVGVVLLALAVAVLPRRADIVGLAAACAAVLIAEQLSVEHWFYLYIPWFFPLVMLALLGRFSDPSRPGTADAASSPARSSLPAAVASS